MGKVWLRYALGSASGHTQYRCWGWSLYLGLGETSGPGCFPHPSLAPILLSARPSESLGSPVPPEPAQWNAPGAPCGAGPAHTSSPTPRLPQERHVVLGVNRVAEDVAFQGGRGLLQPEEQRVAGAQADLERDRQK